MSQPSQFDSFCNWLEDTAVELRSADAEDVSTMLSDLLEHAEYWKLRVESSLVEHVDLSRVSTSPNEVKGSHDG